jgi:hypothetical protein
MKPSVFVHRIFVVCFSFLLCLLFVCLLFLFSEALLQTSRCAPEQCRAPTAKELQDDARAKALSMAKAAARAAAAEEGAG